jgi:hypothetical protein
MYRLNFVVHVCAGAVQESLLPAPDVLLPVPVHRLPYPCHLQPQGLPPGQDQLFRKGVRRLYRVQGKSAALI